MKRDEKRIGEKRIGEKMRVKYGRESKEVSNG